MQYLAVPHRCFETPLTLIEFQEQEEFPLSRQVTSDRSVFRYLLAKGRITPWRACFCALCVYFVLFLYIFP